MSAKRTQEELDKESKLERRAEKEINDSYMLPISTRDIMLNVEKARKKLRKKYPACTAYTKNYLAEKANITYATYQNYLNGRGSIRWNTIQSLAEALHCPVLDLLQRPISEDD